MIDLNTNLSKRNEDVNEVDDSFEHTFIKEKWNEDVNPIKEKWRCKWVDDSFEHTLTKEKWRCRWSRWFIWTHTYQKRNVNEEEM